MFYFGEKGPEFVFFKGFDPDPVFRLNACVKPPELEELNVNNEYWQLAELNSGVALYLYRKTTF